MKSIFLGLIWLYQWTLGPLIGNRCRFYPSCSNYSKEALQKYGTLKGLWLTFKRLGRCHPWHPGGIDFP
ncbi:MAG: membrane protein insertion efficiency factor YidD [Verrucomicrobia bacterium]|nr:membrane protein insertion efficiency factor YidD [Verrucomicrobiota bacterium]